MGRTGKISGIYLMSASCLLGMEIETYGASNFRAMLCVIPTTNHTGIGKQAFKLMEDQLLTRFGGDTLQKELK